MTARETTIMMSHGGSYRSVPCIGDPGYVGLVLQLGELC